MSVVLITTANSPPSGVPHLRLDQPGPRRVAALGAIMFWALSGIKKIVIADATASKLFGDNDSLWVADLGVELEQICYQQDTELIRQRGKGYGEARLLEYALNTSRLINSESSFYKCTGKVYCRNFAEIIDWQVKRNLSNCFWQHFDDRVGFNAGYVDTRFFYTSREYAGSELIPALLHADDRRQAVENCCYNLLVASRAMFTAPRPRLSGLAGGSGQYYSEHDLGYLESNYPAWFW